MQRYRNDSTFLIWQWDINLNFQFYCNIVKSEAKKRDTFKNWPLIKNLQFLSNPHETWWKLSSHEVIIFTKFHEDRTKIVDFLLMANFWKCPVFFAPDFTWSAVFWALEARIFRKRIKMKPQEQKFMPQFWDRIT